jgi:sterol desaturase/sphingolipid hydroxylase (fatty acid hydroxylase superfamily)
MSPSTLRLLFFLGGLATLLSWELASPHHPPTVPRGRRWRANFGFALLNGGVVSALCTACYALAAQGASPWRLGPFQRLPLPPGARWVAEIVVLDLLVYLLHRSYHRVGLLWRFHQVHHTDLDLDVTSSSRFHTGEVLISAVAKLGLVLLLGVSPTGLIAFEVLLLLAAQFQHANVRLPAAVEKWLWWTFVPPAMHRVHHRPNVAETDSNYGTLLTLWDRLFGTLRAPIPEPESFGLAETRREEELGGGRLLALPFRPRKAAGR